MVASGRASRHIFPRQAEKYRTKNQARRLGEYGFSRPKGSFACCAPCVVRVSEGLYLLMASGASIHVGSGGMLLCRSFRTLNKDLQLELVAEGTKSKSPPRATRAIVLVEPICSGSIIGVPKFPAEPKP